VRFTIPIDPATLCTAQQKKIAWKQKVVFANPKVVRSMKTIAAAVAKYQPQARAIFDAAPGHALAVGLKFWFAYPSTGTKAEKAARRAGFPITKRWSGDCDNRAKSVLDALTLAKFWEDDQFVTTLLVRKRYTLYQPRIDFAILPDTGGIEAGPFGLSEVPTVGAEPGEKPTVI